MRTVCPFSLRGRWQLAVSALALLVAFPVPAALAQEDGDLSTRLSHIEREIDTLSRSVYKGEMPPDGITMGIGSGSGTPAAMDERLSRIEQSLRELTGQLEQQGNDVAQVRQALERGLSDVQMRVTTLEQKLGGAAAPSGLPSASGEVAPAPDSPPSPEASAPAASPAPLPSVGNGAAPETSPTVEPLGNLTSSGATGQPVVPSGDPTQVYENAMTLLKQKDYALAEKSFRDFMVAYPSHALLPNVKYWLGETKFAQGQYQEAARLFAEGYQQYPKGPKAAGNLLKLGLSLGALNKNADACVALSQVKKDFPSGAAAEVARAAQEMKRLSCAN